MYTTFTTDFTIPTQGVVRMVGFEPTTSTLRVVLFTAQTELHSDNKTIAGARGLDERHG